MNTQYLQTQNKPTTAFFLRGRNELPQKGYIGRQMLLFSAGRRGLVTTGSSGEARVPGLPSRRQFWKQWLPVAREYWAGNERMLGEGVPGETDKGYLAVLPLDTVGQR